MLSDPCGAARCITKHACVLPSHPHSLCILPHGSVQQPPLSAGRVPVILVRIHWLEKKNLTHKFIMHAASHTTCAIRSVKRVQMSSLCVAGVQSQSCYLIPTAEPSDCSSRPVCVTHKYSVTLRLALFSPDLHRPSLF